MKISRGLRNNNPGNLRISKDNWRGLRKIQTDMSFFQFVSNEYGYRAMIRTLQTYQSKYGLNTIEEIIHKYAPTNENHTDNYIKLVCEWTGIKPNEPVYTRDKQTMIALVAAMSRVENGVPANLAEVEAGWNLL